MRFNAIALSATVALFWGAAILVVASANLIWPTYGRAFLELAASIYPGYHPSPLSARSLQEHFTGWWTGQLRVPCSAGSTICCRANSRARQPNRAVERDAR